MRCNHIKPNRVYSVKRIVKTITFFGLLLCSISLQAQLISSPKQTAGGGKRELIELLHADSVVIINDDLLEVNRFAGNVRFQHKGSLMYCDLAVQNKLTNLIEAFGNVRLVQGDTVTVTGDTLYYYGDTRLAIVNGKKAVLKDQQRTLTTTRIEYDMNSNIAKYPYPGETVDSESKLSSLEGYYNTRTKEYTYYRNVRLVNEKYTLTTDTLLYNSLTKWSYFRGKTEIVNKDGTVTGTRGQYHTETEQSVFETRTTVKDEDYILTGDSLEYDSKKQYGYAKGNVEIISYKDSVILNGNEGIYMGAEGISKVFGRGLVSKYFPDQDTLFIRADTLYSIENKSDSTRKLIADSNVYLFRKDFQAICDSLTFATTDSVIRFFRDPVLWSDNSQLIADTITSYLVNNKINRMLLRSNAFVISKDTALVQYNQVKGRTIRAFFNEESQINQVDVNGNGESAYYATDDKLKLIGLNRVESGQMKLNFKDNRIQRIMYIGAADGKLIPPHEIKTENRQLEGFRLREEEKPTREKTKWLLDPPVNANIEQSVIKDLGQPSK